MREIANSLVRPAPALPGGEVRGACQIDFDDGVTEGFCHNGMTDSECKQLAEKVGGMARPVKSGSVCAN
jgi:hypothetical protein